MPLRTFQSFVADGLISANVRVRGRPSLESLSLPILQRVKRVQSIPTHDVRKDYIDHFPTWELKRQKCRYCNALSFVRCNKCNVWLCFNKSRYCYALYHGK